MITEQVTLEFLLYALGGLSLLIGSLTDLKTREVPDWLSFSLIFSGLGVRLLYSLAFFEWNFFFSGLVGFLIFVAVGYLMFYAGQWGGGDAKLLMGVGAIFGVDFALWPLPKIAVFFLSTLVVGAVYGVGWVAFLAIKHRQAVSKMLVKIHHRTAKVELSVITVSAVLLAGLLALLGVSAITPLGLLLAIFPILGFYGWLLITSVEKVAFYKHVLPTQLTEGDWIAHDVIIDGERICGPSDLGIEKEQIARLIQLRDKGKVDTVLVKEGIPFVPSFLAAYVITLAVGNWLVWLL